MRRLALTLWILIPVALAAYHYGPGQVRLRWDDAARHVARAEQHAARAARRAQAEGDLAAVPDWQQAETAYEAALALLGDAAPEARWRVALERARCQVFVSELPQAAAALQALVDEIEAEGTADVALRADARRALANAQYYMTWLLRLEGAGREDWEPRIDAARQTYKLLASATGADADPAQRARDAHDLEAAIRLARMDLTELQGLPLPSQ